jgi:hypothetical protein
MSDSDKPTLETAVNYSRTRQHYATGLDEFGDGLALCDTDAMPVRVHKDVTVNEGELPFCRRCTSMARRQGLMPQEA